MTLAAPAAARARTAGTSNEPGPWKAWLHELFQKALLTVPALAEMRLAAGKVAAYLRAWHYLARAGVRGDYLEFGVYRGTSFRLALRCAGKFFRRGDAQGPRFFAFDSFAGLPEPDPARDAAGVFLQGEYAAGALAFRRAVGRAARGRQVVIVPGFYEQSLTAEIRAHHHLERAAFVAIDCDLYPSTRTALDFCTPLLQTGSVVYFDDWFFSGGDMTLGEPGACADWLAEHPGLTLIDFGNVGVMGKMFLVNRRPQAGDLP